MPAYLTESRHTEEEAMKSLLESEASFNAVIERSALTYLNTLVDATNLADPILKKLLAPGDVHKYAEKTGGIAVAAHKSEITRKVCALLDAIRSRYTIGYRPARDAAPGTFCRVEVRLTPEAVRRLGDVVIRNKSGYFR